MTDQEMIDLLGKIEVGTEITIGVKCFDRAILPMQGKYMGNLEQHGFYGSGSWGLYKSYPENTPCYRFLFKEIRRRKKCIFPKIGYDIDYIKIAE